MVVMERCIISRSWTPGRCSRLSMCLDIFCPIKEGTVVSVSRCALGMESVKVSSTVLCSCCCNVQGRKKKGEVLELW